MKGHSSACVWLKFGLNSIGNHSPQSPHKFFQLPQGLAVSVKSSLVLCTKWPSAMSACILATVAQIMCSLHILSGNVDGPKVGLCHGLLFFSKRFSVFHANLGIKLAAHTIVGVWGKWELKTALPNAGLIFYIKATAGLFPVWCFSLFYRICSILCILCLEPLSCINACDMCGAATWVALCTFAWSRHGSVWYMSTKHHLRSC